MYCYLHFSFPALCLSLLLDAFFFKSLPIRLLFLFRIALSFSLYLFLWVSELYLHFSSSFALSFSFLNCFCFILFLSISYCFFSPLYLLLCARCVMDVEIVFTFLVLSFS